MALRCDHCAALSFPAWLILITSVGWLCTVGCGRTPAEADSRVEVESASFRDISPEDYLDAVFARYQNAASYQDRGVVRLAYQLDGETVSQVAPVQVWLDHDQLYVAAYDVRLWSDANGLTGWILDPGTEDFDSQVLRRGALPGRPTVGGLLSDPILADRVAGGLAGPPPQLDWLLSSEPMEELFHGGHRFEFLPSQPIDDRLCRGVAVTAHYETYVFWVDEQRSTIRRVELPSIVAPAQVGQPAQNMSLSLELAGASFVVGESVPKISPLPAKPKYLRRLVPLPPVEPPDILGSRAPAFRLPSRDGSWTLSDRGGDREITLLVGFEGDPSSMLSAVTMQSWRDSMPEALRRRVRVALLVDPPSQHRLPANNQLSIVLDDEKDVSRGLMAQPGGVVILDATGRVVWIQPDLTSAGPSGIVQLGAIVSDVLNGVEVPQRIRQQWQEEVNAYRAAVAKQAIPGRLPSQGSVSDRSASAYRPSPK